MAKVYEPANAESATYAADAALQCAISAMTEAMGCSTLSSAAMIFQRTVAALLDAGGPASVDYCDEILRQMRVLQAGDPGDGIRSEVQIKAFQKMADHFDLMAVKAAGSA